MPIIDFITRRPRTFVCLALAAVTFALYVPMLRHGFVSYDDPDYITANPHVTSGLSLTNVVWAFKSGAASNWHPLTWISHMVDCQLFGVNPAGHHLVNLLFHIANTLLLFWWLLQATEWFEGRESREASVSRHPPPVTRHALWRSALVAALFAWHPLHVESVAWAAERKDVLSAFFWMLTLIAWTKHVRDGRRRERTLSPVSCHLTGFYFLALFFFACGLMSKPMVVTLPFVLLLLDWWPFGRIGAQGTAISTGTVIRLIVEKIPFFILVPISAFVTWHVSHGLWTSGSLPLSLRLETAAVSYERYISKTFWPSDLALLYPYPHAWPAGIVVSAILLLGLLTLIFLFQARRFPYLIVGWFWFLGTLVPVIGLVQAGIQSMADRYTYLPDIGLFLLLAWGGNDLLGRIHRRHVVAGTAMVLSCAGCLALTSLQLRYWRSSLGLWEHAVKVTADNYAACDYLGRALENGGEPKAAEAFYAEAVRLEPDYSSAQFDLGMIQLRRGDFNSASNHLAAAIALSPNDPLMQYDFGVFQLQHGTPAQAAEHFEAALRMKPDFAEARQRLEEMGAATNAPINSTR